MKHLLKLFTAFFLSFTALPISNAFSDIVDDSNIDLARQAITFNPQIREHFMNMNIEEFAACTAAVFIIVSEETNNEIALDDVEELHWGIVMVGSGLAGQKLLSMGYSDELLTDAVENMVFLSNEPSTQLIALSECNSYIQKGY